MTAFTKLRSTMLLACVGIGSAFITLAPASAAEVVIQMLGDGSAANKFRYEPAEVEVQNGDTVKWSNNFGSVATHTATPDDGVTGMQPTGNVAPGEESEPQTITAGPITYHCDFHPNDMKGTITVAK
jgi:plastocyanin